MPTHKNEPAKKLQPQPQPKLPKKQKAIFEIEYEAIRDEDYYDCYIPEADIHFSVPIKSKSSVPVQERIKKKVVALWLSFWSIRKKGINIKLKRKSIKPEIIVNKKNG